MLLFVAVVYAFLGNWRAALIPAGLLAGYCYACKMTAGTAIPFAVGVVRGVDVVIGPFAVGVVRGVDVVIGALRDTGTDVLGVP